MNRKKESIRAVRKKVNELLNSPNIEPALEKLLQIPLRQAINSLLSFLYHEEPIIKWRAVTAMGAVVSRLAWEDIEAARVVIRRLMWNLNDESGGIGWGSAEAMGEILASHDALAKEYVTILLSYAREDGNFQEHKYIQRGVLWAIGRVSQTRPELLKETAPAYIMPYLNSTDATIRGIAAWVIGMLDPEKARSELEALGTDENQVQIYLDHNLIKCLVKDLAVEALAKLDK